MIIPYLLALSLFAEISGGQRLLHRHVRRTLPLGTGPVWWDLGRRRGDGSPRPAIFGPAYVMNGTTALRLLPGGPRLRGQGPLRGDPPRAGPPGPCGQGDGGRHLAEAAGAALGGIYWGMTGLCIGWVVGASCEAVVLLPAVIRVFRRDPPVEPDRGGSSG